MTEDDPACPPDPAGPSQVIVGRLVTTPCIEWHLRCSPSGYGQVRREGKQQQAHRWTWAEEHGPIPDGMCVLHRCDNPPCVNLDHLFLGTPKDNMRDMWQKGRGVSLTKLTDAQVEEVRQATGTQASIGLHYGVSRGHVGNIRGGKRRKKCANG